MSKASEAAAFQDRLGYRFKDDSLLEEALTHASLSSSVSRDNQRLEFLGDRVLGLVIAEALLDQDRSADEGALAPRLNAMVRKETCAEVAAEIGLGTAMRMGRSEMLSGGRRKTAMLGDAMEAVIASVYLDAGYRVACEMVLRLWGDRLSKAETLSGDAKTKLQEWAQARGMTPPKYVETSRRGPDHAPLFVIEAQLENGMRASAEARSKRAAQQEAAAALLDQVEGVS